MSDIFPNQTPVPGLYSGDGWIVTWTGVTGGDVCHPGNNLTGYMDRSVQVEGTFGGATCSIAGSIDRVNFHVLNDTGLNPLTFSAAGLREILEAAVDIVPQVVGGSGASLTIGILFRRTRTITG